MDQERKLRLQNALDASKAKGNQRLSEALIEALENDQKRDSFATIIIALTPRVSLFLLFTGIPFEISRAERVRGTGKRVRESVQQRPLPAEGKTHANAAVSVRRRPGQPPRSGVRVRY